MTEENEDHYSVDLFQQFVTEFVMFSAVNGTAVPCKASNTIVYKWKERELACFIDTTNKSLRKCTFHLSKKQVQILKKRDYPFSVSVDESWEHGFRLLENYKEDHGNCDAHRRDPDIGRWLSYQRECYKKGFLSRDQISKLESIAVVGGGGEIRPPWGLVEASDAGRGPAMC